MERITVYDRMRQCYIIPPEADERQGQIIQQLGMLEDKAFNVMRDNIKDVSTGEYESIECGRCGHPVGASYNFCPECGQRVARWDG